ncbi:MAG: peptidoglycan DD-metalloendopeptidase family protein, partial [Sphingopyxis sp.]
VTVAAREYIVVAGDTLRGIGNRTGAGSEAIARANSLVAPYILNVGQRIAIPGGRYHDVQAGQTGIAIARAYGVDWAQVVADNGLVEPFTLRVGQKLRLPAGTNPTRPLTMEEQAQAFTLDIDDIMTGGRPAGPATAASTTTRAASTAATPRGASASASAASSGAASAAPSGGGALAGTIRFVWPLRGAIVQRFGAAGGGRVNDGINIAATVGAPVHASAAGTVAYSGSEIGPLGGLVLIDHGNGWVSAYGHLDRVAVRSGERVVADTVIGTAGETGQVQSPQLHFQIRQNRRPVDPMRYLPAR